MMRPVRAFQRIGVASLPPEIKALPSLETARHHTTPACPASGGSCCPVRRSPAILGDRRRLAGASSVLVLDPEKLAEQSRSLDLSHFGQQILDSRPHAFLPGTDQSFGRLV